MRQKKILDLELEEGSGDDIGKVLDLIEDGSDVEIITLEEEKPEDKLPISKEDVVSLVRDTIKQSLGKLD